MGALRKIIYPFGLLYGGIMRLRNKAYDRGWLESREYPHPVIAVGNLSVGGTGKSPMVEYLISLLKERWRVGTLSRGYKRSTSGFLLLTGEETAGAVGDEPLQFKNKFPEVLVAVDEDRRHGIDQLLHSTSPPQVIILDDAFQHRKVHAGMYILLSAYGAPYSEDLMLPAGNLREPRSGAARASIIVVTKCPVNLSGSRREAISKKLRYRPEQPVFFSTIDYSDRIRNTREERPVEFLKNRRFTLVTGIANPDPMVEHLQQQQLDFVHRAFPDHHNFNASELESLQGEDLILTTEKDYMRLRGHLNAGQLYYLPIQTRLLEGEEIFKKLVLDFVQKK